MGLFVNTNFPGKLKIYLPWLIMIAGILMPAIIVTLFPELFHASDLDDFRRWSQSWGANWQNIYVDCERCNYPFLGTMTSGGVMSWMGIKDFAQIVPVFRYYLAVIDGLNVVIAWFILMKLRIKHAPLWAGLIGLLPSSWFGSSTWGQIDGIGQLLIMLMLFVFVWFNLSSETGRPRYFVFIILIGLLMSLTILTKQLIMFSLLSLGFMAVMNVFLYSQKPKEIMLSLVILVFAFILPIVLIDLNLNLKAGYFSHLQYVLDTGSQHGDIISSFGFNVWTFLARSPSQSSHVPLNAQLSQGLSISIVPFGTGIFLFLLVNALLFFLYMRYFYGQYKNGSHLFKSIDIFLLILHLALVNLSFNLLLTGTHERYLYHFYPFVIMAWSGLDFLSRKLIYVLSAGAIFYAVVLYAYLTDLIDQFGQAPFAILFIFHTGVFLYLMISLLNYFKQYRHGIESYVCHFPLIF
jgi:hypothetical protein